MPDNVPLSQNKLGWAFALIGLVVYLWLAWLYPGLFS